MEDGLALITYCSISYDTLEYAQVTSYPYLCEVLSREPNARSPPPIPPAGQASALIRWCWACVHSTPLSCSFLYGLLPSQDHGMNRS